MYIQLHHMRKVLPRIVVVIISVSSMSHHQELGPLFALLSHPDHVMYAVNITVSNVDSDCSESEPILLPRAVDGDWRVQDIDHGTVVSAGGRVARGGVGREGARRHGTRQRGGTVLLH